MRCATGQDYRVCGREPGGKSCLRRHHEDPRHRLDQQFLEGARQRPEGAPPGGGGGQPAVSVPNGCEYCPFSHTAAARKRGMSDAMFMELMAVVGLANQTNRLSDG